MHEPEPGGTKGCGRIDDHDPHPWLGGHAYFVMNGGIAYSIRYVYRCTGHVTVEGGGVYRTTTS